MKRVLVTGANGLVGSNLCHRLAETGYEVNALVRESSNLLALNGFRGKIVKGDVSDRKFLDEALAGIDIVFHTAGLVSFDNRRREELFAVNVRGTRNVMESSLSAGVGRLVHFSSVAAIGIPHAGVSADENTEYNKLGYHIAYADSKYFGEREVMSAVANGLDAVIVNPASIVGAGDVYSHFGVLLRILKGKRFIPCVRGGMCVVGVDDVVDGAIAAMLRGRKGERYILGGENLSFRELFLMIGDVVGASGPVVEIPISVARAAATVLELISAFTGKPPVLTKAHVVSATLPHYFSHEKASRELGYTPHPVRDSIRKSFDWSKEHGLI